MGYVQEVKLDGTMVPSDLKLSEPIDSVAFHRWRMISLQNLFVKLSGSSHHLFPTHRGAGHLVNLISPMGFEIRGNCERGTGDSILAVG